VYKRLAAQTMAVFVFLLVGLAPAAHAADGGYAFWSSVGKRAAAEAWRLLGGKPADMLVLTNAGFAVVGGDTTQASLDGLSEATGCTVGKGNLLAVHSSREKPLWFLFFDKASGKAAYCEPDPLFPADRPFRRLAVENIGADKLLADPGAWDKKARDKVFGGNEFSVVTIANVVAQGVPYDFVQAVLFHDHLCPGATSGYLIAGYLNKHLPLRSPAERYYIVALPPWCKDDALQVLLNTTPGKSGLAVIPMNDADKQTLVPEAKNLAGIYIRWDGRSKTGDGLVLGFDFGKGYALSGIDAERGYPWESRLRLDLWYSSYLSQPDMFVNVIKRFTLTGGEVPADYARPGVNPLVKLGLVR
jgi:formylmethanofuran dehydrogenase subunit E-like metal-binding protein